VTPVRSVDKIKVGAGKPGPITKALQTAFFKVINGEVPDRHGWLTYVYPEEASLRERPKAIASTGR
jgi:branched-chain amino acid aminotransferase